MSVHILGIESSCDDTSAAVSADNVMLSNLIANQEIHRHYGGVVPELASRAHQQNIIPVIDDALRKANIRKNDLDAVAFTRGPGLLGSLMVGTSFAKSFALALGLPILDINHMEAHVMALFIQDLDGKRRLPSFPFLCLTVSGGHTQIILMRDHFDFTIVGQTIDDAAGEAFDKAAKIMGLPYPGGPEIDRLAKSGNPDAFRFPMPSVPGLDFSFSGLKTSFLYHVRDRLKNDPLFIEKNREDLAASIQKTIVAMLMKKFEAAARQFKVRELAIAGGVSANSMLRESLTTLGAHHGWQTYIPKFEYCTDNAAMIAVTGYFKFLRKEFSSLDIAPFARTGSLSSPASP